MSIITVDTYLVVKELIESGFSEKQAEGLIKAAKKADLSNVATKKDVAFIQNGMKELEYRLVIKMGGLMAIGIGVMTALDKLI